MMCVHDGLPVTTVLTEAEEKDLARPPGIRNQDLARVTGNEVSRIIMSQMVFDSEREKEVKERRGSSPFGCLVYDSEDEEGERFYFDHEPFSL
jgi:hypothetical protein